MVRNRWSFGADGGAAALGRAGADSAESGGAVAVVSAGSLCTGPDALSGSGQASTEVVSKRTHPKSRAFGPFNRQSLQADPAESGLASETVTQPGGDADRGGWL